MKIKVIASLILIAILAPIVFVGGYLIVGLIMLVAGLAYFEAVCARSAAKNWPIGIRVFMIAIGMLMVSWNFLLKMAFQAEYQLDYSTGAFIPTLGLIAVLITLFIMAIIYPQFEVSDVAYTFTMMTLITLGCQSFLFIALKHEFTTGQLVLAFPDRILPAVFIITTTYMVDTGGYIVGNSYGGRFKRHKLNPRISPNKSVEGMIGACAFGLITALAFALIPAFKMPYYNAIGIILIGILLTAGAQVGDLMFSAIKRHYKIKDFGNLIPGHGGILDRIDSLLVNAMLFMIVDVLVVRYNTSGVQDIVKFIVEIFTR